MLPGVTFAGSGNVYTLDIDADVDNLTIGNLPGTANYLDAVNRPIDLHIQVRAGVTVGAAVNAGAQSPDHAMTIDLPAGSRVFLTNLGTIAGGGGIGGQGDRGRRDNGLASSFVGGGGGGGAGSSSQGGAAATESDPDDDSTDGAAGTSTTGGTAGTNDSGAGIPNGGFTAGTAPQFGGDAIYFGSNAIEIYIDNSIGDIHAGGAGGDGGYQDGTLPGGAVDPEAGHDLATSVTTLEGASTTEAKGVSYKTGSTLTWEPAGGALYPRVRGYINRRP